MRTFRPILFPLRNTLATSYISARSNSTDSTAWLSSLKASQLQHLAFLTGISSSGTKPVLIDRLSRVFMDEREKEASLLSDDAEKKADGRMSILSIDMGIRNLAYAYLTVSPSAVTPASKETKKAELPRTGSWDVVLNAWNRLAVSSFPVEQGDGVPDNAVVSMEQFNGGNSPASKGTPTTCTRQKTRRKNSRKSQSAENEEAGTEEREPLSITPSKEAEKESFAPNVYASHAYTLITSLIAAYKPTHILIERQRFRSGGGSAVQEWTIRVGVFEGMLYAVLQTLKRESRRIRRQQQRDSDAGIEDIHIMGVEPQRVAKYWAEKARDPVSAVDKGQKGKSRITSKEGKKAKIDAVGSLIGAGIDSSSGATGLKSATRSVGRDGVHVRIGESAQVGEVVAAFLDKWNRGNGRRRASSTTRNSGDDYKSSSSTKSPENVSKGIKAKERSGTLEIGKLDDLADSVLQGLTWLAWRDMRARIAREGRNAVSFE